MASHAFTVGIITQPAAQIPDPKPKPPCLWPLSDPKTVASGGSFIVRIITQSLPLGVVVLLGLGASMLTKTSTFAAAFSAFGNPILWIISLTFL
ncbi:hypothetical protein ACLB2K_012834 [Fragaria x ananassa]